MDNEQEQPIPGDRRSSPGSAPRVRLPGYDERSRRGGPAEAWQGYDQQGYDQQGYDQQGSGWQGYGYGPPRGYPAAARHAVRSSRRASTWTAAALIAGVAVSTGYLARSIPVNGAGSSNNTSGGTAKLAAKPGPTSPGTVRPSPRRSSRRW